MVTSSKDSHHGFLDYYTMKWTSRTYLILVSVILFLGLSCSSDEDALPHESDYDFPEGKVFFDTPPLDLAGVMFFEPMGFMGVFPQDHGGFHHVEAGVPEPSTAIYAMADGQIRALGKSGPDFWVDIKYSTTISTKLGHVGRFEDFILEKTGPLIEGQPQFDVGIDVAKGQGYRLCVFLFCSGYWVTRSRQGKFLLLSGVVLVRNTICLRYIQLFYRPGEI